MKQILSTLLFLGALLMTPITLSAQSQRITCNGYELEKIENAEDDFPATLKSFKDKVFITIDFKNNFNVTIKWPDKTIHYTTTSNEYFKDTYSLKMQMHEKDNPSKMYEFNVEYNLSSIYMIWQGSDGYIYQYRFEFDIEKVENFE